MFICGHSYSVGICSRRPKGLVHSSCLFSPPAASSFFSRAEQGRAGQGSISPLWSSLYLSEAADDKGILLLCTFTLPSIDLIFR